MISTVKIGISNIIESQTLSSSCFGSFFRIPIYLSEINNFLKFTHFFIFSCPLLAGSLFGSFATRMVRPLLKLKRSVLLVMYSWLKGFYCVMNSKYSITLLFFGSNSRRASLLSPHPSIVSIASILQRT